MKTQSDHDLEMIGRELPVYVTVGEPPVRSSELVLCPVVVTQGLVNEIIARAKASRWGLDDAKCETSLAHYADEDEHALAMILVNGWEAKYDLVSLFAAAIAVVNEKAQNDQAQRPERNNKKD